MTEDAFARRFYADRAELDALGHPPAGRQARRRLLRAGELLARARGLPPAGDRVLRRRARGAADRADAARRRVRLRRAAAPGAAADHLGAPEPARHGLAPDDRPRHHRLGRRQRALGPPGQGRHRDLPPQADRVRVLHDAVRRDRAAQGRPVPPAVRGRPVVPRRPLARARRRARVPALADPRQGRLLDQGRARLPAPRRLRPARLREPHPVAARRPGRHRRGLGLGARSPGTSSASSAPTATMRDAEDGGRIFRTDYAIPRLLVSWALRFGDQARVCGPPELVEESRARLDLIIERHRGEAFTSVADGTPPAPRRAGGRGRRALARRRGRRSGPSASRAWSRSPPC